MNGDKRSEVQSEALADQIHDACPHKIDEPPNCALVKSRLECACEHVHMHAIRAARSGASEVRTAIAWHAYDDRYPYIRGIVTTQQETVDAWRESGIKFEALAPIGAAQEANNCGADAMIGEIEKRFPDWKGFRDLVDCIDVTLHRLRWRST